MADVLEIPNKYRRRMSRQLADYEVHRKLFNQRWFLVCELIWLHKHGR